MASPLQFFDPFFIIDNPTPPSAPKGITNFAGTHLISKLLPIHLDEGYSNIGQGATLEPPLQPLVPTAESSRLPVTGQGTIAVLSNATDLLRFTIKTNLLNGPTLHLDIGRFEFLLYYIDEDGQHQIPIHAVKPITSCYLTPPTSDTSSTGGETKYWLSLDSRNGIIRYGKEFVNKSMVYAEVTLKKLADPGVMVWIDPKKFSWLEALKTANVTQDKDASKPSKTVVLPLPVVLDLSPFIAAGDEISLVDLETGAYTVPVNLPKECQVLYGNVAGKKIVLNDADFPDFGRAIERSCTTEGGWAYKKLKEKAGEFGKEDLNGTYLRITIGYNLGDSPGIPYVLEIWPSGHYSPIHDHGNACAVIKVLYGDITASYFDSLKDPKLINTAHLKEGAITWLSPDNYQIHKLYNQTKGVCCTIQCYRYLDQDDVHYDAFNYTGPDGKTQKFEPNSDMAFLEFRKKMKEEWESRPEAKAETNAEA